MKEVIKKILDSLLKSEDEIYLVDFQVNLKGKKQLVEVFVDTDNGVTLDQCSAFSKNLAKQLEESGFFGDDQYVIEVSSPGLSKPLMILRQYKKAIGKELTVKYKIDSEEITKTMLLKEVDGNNLSFESNNNNEELNFENIEKATYHLKW